MGPPFLVPWVGLGCRGLVFPGGEEIFEITGFLQAANESYPQVGIKLGKSLTPV